MNKELTEALKSLKDKGGKPKQAAIKAEIVIEYSERMQEALSKGEFWRLEIIAKVYGERLKAASRPQFKQGGATGRTVTIEDIKQANEYANSPGYEDSHRFNNGQ